MFYNVSFKYSESVYCANIAEADTIEEVNEAYSKYAWFCVTEAKPYDIEEAKRRGKPIIRVKKEA